MATHMTSVRSGSTAITPFWRRIPFFFLFPAYPSALLRVLGLAVLASVPFAINPGGIVFILILLFPVAWVIFLRYAFVVLEQTSLGHLSPADYPFDAGSVDSYKPYKQLAVIVLMGVLVGVVTVAIGEVPGLIAYGLLAIAMPASIMLVAIENSIRSAMHPGKLIHIMFSIGWPYLALCAFLLLLSVGQAELSGWLNSYAIAPFTNLGISPENMSGMEEIEEIDPSMLEAAQASVAARFRWIFVLLNAVGMYFTLIMYNMMGYVLYQYHEELGLDVAVKPDGDTEEADSTAARIGRLVADGDADAALDLAYEDQRTNPTSIAAHDRYHKLLLRGGHDDRALAHAKNFITMLLQQSQGRQAMTVLETMLRKKRDFEPANLGEFLQLAQIAANSRQGDIALRLLDGYLRRSNAGDLPKGMLLKAKVLCEHMHQDEQARTLLIDLIARHPAHPLVTEAQQYLQLIDRLRQA